MKRTNSKGFVVVPDLSSNFKQETPQDKISVTLTRNQWAAALYAIDQLARLKYQENRDIAAATARSIWDDIRDQVGK